MTPLQFDHAAVLALLPLALLPLLGTRRDALRYPSVIWLPPDRAGRLLEWLWRALAAATLAALIAALAGPHLAETRVERIGRGAEIAILLDRSASMDTDIRLPPPALGEAARESRSKMDVVRGALLELVAARPDNRYALTLFNVVPMRVAPFGDDVAVVRAGLDAAGIGRGPSKTDMGRALLAAVDAFEGRDYTGSRAILLVSDGGARLDEETREAVRRGLVRNRVALYFIYVRSSPNSPDLETVGRAGDTSLEEVALHVFFEQLGTEYHVHQADDPESMAEAVAAIDSRQNQPLTTFERVPRTELRHVPLAVALFGALALLALGATRLALGGASSPPGGASPSPVGTRGDRESIGGSSRT